MKKVEQMNEMKLDRVQSIRNAGNTFKSITAIFRDCAEIVKLQSANLSG